MHVTLNIHDLYVGVVKFFFNISISMMELDVYVSCMNLFVCYYCILFKENRKKSVKDTRGHIDF